MEVITIDSNTQIELENSVVALGFFDGFHLGHQKLLESVINISKNENLKKGIMTFSNQPLAIIKNQDYYYLTSLEEKMDYIEKLGFDYFFIIDFNNHVITMEPDTFIQKFIIKNNIKEVVCGYDFTFGFKGKGKPSLFNNYTNNFKTTLIDKVEIDKHKISSSKIKEIIQSGNLEESYECLGRNYSLKGIVVHGKKLGRQIGFPTANVDYLKHILPPKGVYAVYVEYNNHRYKGMANIGVNPTLSNLNKVSLEVNIFDFEKDIYDEEITVEFVEFIRSEVTFDSKEKLIQQLQNDRLIIRDSLKK